MSDTADVIVIGAGIGGLCAAILLGGSGLRVQVLERGAAVGGKAGRIVVDGVSIDTGPSVLTLPHVFDEVFRAADMEPSDVLQLTRPNPGFRYLYGDGTELDVHHELGPTLDSVRGTLGSNAAKELEEYLAYAENIWQAAAPHFVFDEAPKVSKLLFGPVKMWGRLAQVDPLSTLRGAIEQRVKSPHLRMLLKRYATYNGSDARTAPATLGCIAHVELALGGYGLQGGMYQLSLALEEAARRVGVEFRFNCEVTSIEQTKSTVVGVTLSGAERLTCTQLVANGDAAALPELLSTDPTKTKGTPASMSAYTGIIRAEKQASSRVPHTVLFPDDYDQEFTDIFDLRQPPSSPTVYLCAQSAAHDAPAWERDEPLFVMVNAPPVDEDWTADGAVQGKIRERALASQLIKDDDEYVWWRTPGDLATQFPGSRGSLYGAASNTRTAAFQRPHNRHPRVRGLYLASGSAHPGGGVPMVALSGRQAARAALQDRGIGS